MKGESASSRQTAPNGRASSVLTHIFSIFFARSWLFLTFRQMTPMDCLAGVSNHTCIDMHQCYAAIIMGNGNEQNKHTRNNNDNKLNINAMEHGSDG